MPPPVQTPDPRIATLPAAEIRRRFVEFFAERGHTPVPSASLVPAGDATLLYYMTEEAQEGRDAFVEKRAPDFTRFPKRP